MTLAILVVITLVNLRGVRESGSAFAMPTYLFVVSVSAVLIAGIAKSIAAPGHPMPIVAPPRVSEATGVATLWILLRSFASGCTAMTGVEAVSNGVSLFKEPRVRRARATLTTIVSILRFLLIGIAYLCHAYGITAMDQMKRGYQSVLSSLAAAVVGRGPLYYVTLASILAVLSLSANTSFSDFPRLCRFIAEDNYLPHSLANVGRRLVYSTGIIVLAVLAGTLLIVFRGITDRLIPLFAVGAFGAFTLSQAGMVVHWRQKRGNVHRLVLNAIGATATAIALVVIIVAKFAEGAWITLAIIPLSLMLFAGVKRHYAFVERNITVLHVTFEGNEDAIRREWDEKVAGPMKAAGLTPPNLVSLQSPYRKLFTPILDYVDELRKARREMITVILPDLVEGRWWEYLLHMHRADVLRSLLPLRGNQRAVVVSVPWYLERRRRVTRSR